MRRVLIVTYYFPPSGGAGVQRVLKWVKYLRDFGIEPVVLTVEAGAYPELDETLVRDVPPGLAVHRTRSLDPFGAYARLTGRSRQDAIADATGRISDEEAWTERLARGLRANVFLPDARIGWVPFAVREASRLHRAAPFDAVLTSGPPHSAHLVGRALQQRTGLPWIADFRDPWTDIHYNRKLPRTATARRLDAAMERSVLSRASAVTTVSPSLRTLLVSKVERPDGFCHVIYNGFDADDFAAGLPGPDDEAFVLSYVGTLYEQPEALWQALARLRRRGEAERLRVRLVGRVPPGTPAVLAAHGLDDIVRTVPYVTHDEAIREMASATLLLLTIEAWPHEEIILPGKTFEYLAAGRPVLGLGSGRGDAARLLRETGAGAMIERDDAEGLAAYLLERYEAWERGAMPGGASPEVAAPFARRAQTGELADLVERITEETYR